MPAPPPLHRTRLRIRPRGVCVCAAAAAALALGVAGRDAGWLALASLLGLLALGLLAGLRAARAAAFEPLGALRVTAGRARPVTLVRADAPNSRRGAAIQRVRIAAPGRLGLAPWARVREAQATVPAALGMARRGPLSQLEVEVEAVDPLGLTAVRRSSRRAAEGWVLPRPAARGRWLSAALRALAAGTGAAAARAARAGEVHGLEAWRPGAPLRRLHAAASLRTGQPLQLTFEDGQRGPVRVVLRAAAEGSGAAFERAVSVAATLVGALAAEGRPIQVEVPAVRGFGPVRARGASGALLLLARTQRDGAAPAPAAGRARPAAARGDEVEVVPEGEAQWPLAGVRLECAADGAVRVLRAGSAAERAGVSDRARPVPRSQARPRGWSGDVRAVLALGGAALVAALVVLAVEHTRGPLALALALALALGAAARAAQTTSRESGARTGPAVRSGLALAGGALGFALAILGLGGATHRALLDSAERRAEERRARAEASAVDRAALARTEARAQPSEAMRDVLDFAAPGGSSLVSDAEVLRVEALDPPTAAPVLYLRHLTLGQLDARELTSVDRRPPRARRDGDDGAVDGWVTVPGPTAAGAPLRRMTIEARPLTLGDRAWTLLPVPTPLRAVSVEPLRYADDGPSVLDRVVRSGRLRYDALSEVQAPALRAVAGARATGAAADLALPPESPALRALRLRAKRLTRGASSDLEKVLAVVRHLQGFEYSLEASGFGGVEALAAFLERGRGHCTECAATAMVLLRAAGVPARVAVGFLARAEPGQPGAFAARERDAHAWLEVPFEGHGWLTFDPTPSPGRHGGLAAGWSPFVDEPPAGAPRRPWLGAAFEDALDAWRAGERGVADLAAAALAPLWAPLAAVAVGALLLALWRRRAARGALGRGGARRGQALGEGARAGQPATDLHAALSQRLAALGVPRPAHRPLAEHAARIAHAPQVLPSLVQAAYTQRFGRGVEATQAPALWEVATNLELAQPRGHSPVADRGARMTTL